LEDREKKDTEGETKGTSVKQTGGWGKARYMKNQ